MAPLLHRAKSKAQKLFGAPARDSSSATSPIASSVSAQPAPEPTRPPPLGTASPPATETEPLPLPSLQEKIWNRAYDDLRAKQPKLVEAFAKVVLAELHRNETSAESVHRTENEMITNRAVWSHQMWQFVQDGLERTRKEASFKQRIDDSLPAAHAVRGFMGRAIRAAPEAAVVWATVYLGIEVLSNPVTEALENRRGIKYIVCRMEWYWSLVDLLLDENKGETSTAALRGELEKNIVRLFQKLLSYQMRSICLYHRNQAAIVGRDIFRIDDWGAQLSSIKEAERAVQRDMEQYSSEETKMQLRQLNDAATSLEHNLERIHAAAQDQTEQQAKRHEDDKDKQCLTDLRVTDPRTDKKEIEDRKGGLLKESYKWILEHTDFQRFQNEKECRILWIKGDPGKGKTMLLCGIIDELVSDPSVALSYFFCQATGGDRLNKATSVLRGLIYDLARCHPQLTKHVRKKYDYAGKELFNNEGAWHDLCEIATAMLNDPSLENAVLIVDALDECSVDRQRLLDFITKRSPAKWIVSSRNWLDIEDSLDDTERKVKLHLELNRDSVSMAVESYVKYKVNQLAQKNKYDEDMKNTVLRHLTANANGTFLWVALVCQELSNANIRRRHTLGTLKSLPPGLDPLYRRMLEQISQSTDAQLCREILAKALVVYRPVTLEELHVLVKALEDLTRDEVEEVIGSCGSFLTLHQGLVSFVHQSAKDYLLQEASGEIFPSGIAHQHQMVFVRSLDLLYGNLKRDIYHLQAPGRLIDEVSAPDPDPLAPIRYSCIFWADHLHDSAVDEMLGENDIVLDFFQKKYLQWLEALGLLRSIPAGVRAMEKLQAYLHGKASQHIQDIGNDARRFLLSHKGSIEVAPLQVYVSALIFSPINSLIRRLFSQEEPSWIELKPRVEANWNACLQTLEGQDDWVTSVAFSKDGQRLASGSSDRTVKIWDATSGACLQTLKGHNNGVTSAVFSNDGQRLASGSHDRTVKIWDATSGACLQTLKGHDEWVTSVVFSNDGQQLASGSYDKTVKIWDATSSTCLQTLEGHNNRVTSMVFSNDGQRLASGSHDRTVKIWDATSSACLQTLEGHDEWVRSVVFSNDGQRLASGSSDRTVKIWDATSGACLQTLKGHNNGVASVVFSEDRQQLASGSDDKTVKIWDATSGACLQTFQGHDREVTSVVFSKDGQQLASGSFDKTVKIWDATSGACLQTLGGHDDWVTLVAFSKDGQRLASGSFDETVKVWDATSGTCLQTLKGHDDWVTSVVFSNDGQRLASGSYDKTVKIWDATSGACLHTLKGHNGEVASVVFSNDGERLASGSDDETVKIWDATSGACLQTLKGHDEWVTSVVFSNDGQRLASGSYDKTVKIWDATSGACLHTLKGHNGEVTSVVFSEDRQQLASGSDDKTVKIWDATSGACLQTLVVGRTICHCAFDSFNDSRLSTDVGVLDLDMGMSVAMPSIDQASLPHSNFYGYGIGVDGAWIMKSGQRVLWLPQEWRGVASVVAGTTVVLGCWSGRVLIIGFRHTS